MANPARGTSVAADPNARKAALANRDRLVCSLARACTGRPVLNVKSLPQAESAIEWRLLRGKGGGHHFTSNVDDANDQAAFIQTVKAVRTLVDEQLWREKYRTFREFAEDRNVGRCRLYQIARCAYILNVGDCRDSPCAQGCRPLTHPTRFPLFLRLAYRSSSPSLTSCPRASGSAGSC